jgi:hypothetical protein
VLLELREGGRGHDRPFHDAHPRERLRGYARLIGRRVRPVLSTGTKV